MWLLKHLVCVSLGLARVAVTPEHNHLHCNSWTHHPDCLTTWTILIVHKCSQGAHEKLVGYSWATHELSWAIHEQHVSNRRHAAHECPGHSWATHESCSWATHELPKSHAWAPHKLLVNYSWAVMSYSWAPMIYLLRSTHDPHVMSHSLATLKISSRTKPTHTVSRTLAVQEQSCIPICNTCPRR